MSAEPGTCPTCGAAVMTSGRDVLCEVYASIMVDPIILGVQEQAACVITGRAMYRAEQASWGVNLGRKHPGTDERWMAGPEAVLAAHRCRQVFTGDVLPGYLAALTVQHTYKYAELPF